MTSTVPVAIIGMGCLFPRAENLKRYWINICNGVDAIREVPSSHWNPDDYHDPDPKAPDRTYARRGGFLDPVDFPALDFGIAPNNLDATDTTQLLGLMVAKAALEDAGYGTDKDFDRERVSVLLGVTGTLELVIPLGARLGHPIWRRALSEAGVEEPIASDVVQRISDSYVGWQENSFPGLLGNVAAGRIANRLDLGGTNCVIDAACASSLGAVHLAMLELAGGRCDVALTGGLDTFNDIFMYMCFSKTPALSPTGDARPFSSSGDGTTLGEGLGVLTLKRLDDARRDGDRIYAVIKGMGTSSDGKGNAVYAPSASGQARCLRRAYTSAGVSPESIELVEAHGTGTKVGDAVELSALAEVYRSSKAEGTWCALGSVKSQIGHTKAAAGAAGLIKAALALYHKVLPPTIKIDQPADLARPGASPFYLNTEARPWLANPDHPRRAAVSAFGFGGSNFHCVLEEAQPTCTEVLWDGDTQIVAFSGASVDQVRNELHTLPEPTEWDAFRLASAQARTRFRVQDDVRLLIVVQRDGVAWPRLLERARALLQGNTSDSVSTSPDGVYLGVGGKAGGLAVLFPGQGSQYVGMLRDLACRFPAMNQVLNQAGGALVDQIYPHPSYSDEGRDQAERTLRATEVAQPSLGAVSLGAYRVLQSFGLKPDAVAGHSFGELTALNAGGRIDDASFQKLARLRGELMAQAGQSPSGDRGGMLAVMAPVEVIESLMAEEKLDLVLANRNAPRQTVLSGPSSEIARASVAFESRGISTRILEVAAAFHSRFVDSATIPLLKALQEINIQEGIIPVYANTTAEPYPTDPILVRKLLAEQLARPVQFVQEVQSLFAAGIRTYLEVGPEARLTGLVNATLEGQGVTSLALDASKGRRGGNVADLAKILSHLTAVGHDLDLVRWDEGFEGSASARRKAGLTVKVSGANATPKPSPPRPRLTPPTVASRQPSPPESPAPMKPTPKSPTPALVKPALPDHRMPSGRNGTLPSPALRVSATDSSASSSILAEQIRVSQENLVALQKLAEQTASLHRLYLEGQDRATQTFQTLLDHQQRLTFEGGGSRPAPASLPVGRPSATPPPAPSIPAPKPRVVPPPQRVEKPNRPSKPVGSPVPVVQPPARVSRVDAVRKALVEVVSEKTGYPAEVLDPSMQLDADLGIDSIKRVEILAALQERLPEAPVIGPEHLGTIRTLGQIIEFLGESKTSTAAPTPIPVLVSSSTRSALLEVVSEKTGYPVEVLDPSMQLDADLGIDSIKRVEILAAVQERLPGAPVIGPEHLGTIRTLGQIIAFLDADSGDQAREMSPSPSSSSSPTPTPTFVVQQALIEVVSEKTGYPAEVLEPGMQLDADLGIDSIKRVEILAALQERLPEAPVIGPEHLGTIRTLGQIAAFLGGAAEAISAVETARPKTRPIPSEITEPVRRYVPTVVGLEQGDRRSVVTTRPGGNVWVLEDGSRLTGDLLESLGGLGFSARSIASSEIASIMVPDQLAGLILLSPASGSTEATILNSFRLLRRASPALKRAGGDGGSALVTVSRVDGSFGLGGLVEGSDVVSGGLAGLAKSASREWPEVACKAIDLHPGWVGVDIASGIVEEMFRRGPTEVGLSAGGRTTLVLQADQEPLEGNRVPLAPGDVVLISGGARGVTAEVAVSLAAGFRPTVVLLGRTAPPSVEAEWLRPLTIEADIKRGLHAPIPWEGRSPSPERAVPRDCRQSRDRGEPRPDRGEWCESGLSSRRCPRSDRNSRGDRSDPPRFRGPSEGSCMAQGFWRIERSRISLMSNSPAFIRRRSPGSMRCSPPSCPTS